MTGIDTQDGALGVAEIAKIFGVRPYTVREWLKNETLQGFKIPGGHWRVRKSVVQEFAQKMYGENE